MTIDTQSSYIVTSKELKTKEFNDDSKQEKIIAPAITGVGIFIPTNRITNEELVHSYNAYAQAQNEQRAYFDAPQIPLSSAAFIEQASGIKSRYVLEKSGIVDPDFMCPRIPERPDFELSVQAEFAVSSARQAIRNARLDVADIDIVICACAHHQRPYPAMAIEIQKSLGCTGAAFDMNVACSSTAFALHLAAQLIRAGGVQNVLICSPEIMSGHLNFRDRQTHFIFGDASAAVVVSNVTSKPLSGQRIYPTFEIVTSEIWTSFSSNIRSNFGFLNRAAPGSSESPDRLVTQVGSKVFKDIVVSAGRRIRWFLDRANTSTTQVHRYWLHQANAKLIKALMRYIDPDIEEERVPIVLDEIGNVASPGALIAFYRTLDAVPVGGVGLMASFGAGYSVGCLLLKRIS